MTVEVVLHGYMSGSKFSSKLVFSRVPSSVVTVMQQPLYGNRTQNCHVGGPVTRYCDKNSAYKDDYCDSLSFHS